MDNKFSKKYNDEWKYVAGAMVGFGIGLQKVAGKPED